MRSITRALTRAAAPLALVLLAACAAVPRESVELANTVGRDLEAVHDAHLALVELHFDEAEAEVDRFIDETYRPAFIAEFARELRLPERVAAITAADPDKLQPMLARFVTIATERVEAKRAELVEPIRAQRRQVLAEVEQAYRRIVSAHAIVTGHLASVRDVQELQGEALARAGLEGLPQRIADTTARVSRGVDEVVRRGREVDARIADVGERVRELDAAIDAARASISAAIEGEDEP